MLETVWARTGEWIKVAFSVALHFFIFHTTCREEIQLPLALTFFLGSQATERKRRKKRYSQSLNAKSMQGGIIYSSKEINISF